MNRIDKYFVIFHYFVIQFHTISAKSKDFEHPQGSHGSWKLGKCGNIRNLKIVWKVTEIGLASGEKCWLLFYFFVMISLSLCKQSAWNTGAFSTQLSWNCVFCFNVFCFYHIADTSGCHAVGCVMWCGKERYHLGKPLVDPVPRRGSCQGHVSGWDGSLWGRQRWQLDQEWIHLCKLSWFSIWFLLKTFCIYP